MKPPVNAAGQPMRERILLIGPEKSGKTHAHLSVAAMHQKTGSKATFFILDTDLAIERMLMPGGDFAGLSNIVYEEVSDWAALTDATKRFRDKIKTGDFLVVDMMTQAWEYVQRFYIEQIYGMDAETYFLVKQKEAHDAGKKVMNFGEAIEWPIVNKLYYPWATSLISNPAHVFMVAGEKELAARDREQMKDYIGQGVKPAAQKQTGHLAHTVLRVRSQKQGEPRFNTIGDRGRPALAGEVIKNFALSYLVKVAGWGLK